VFAYAGDIVPTGEALARADARLALDYWPWSLLAQAEPLPERLILADPEIVVDDALGGWGTDRTSFPPEVRTAYIAALRDPDTVHAICEEYRAAATVDFARDTKDRLAASHVRCSCCGAPGAVSTRGTRTPAGRWAYGATGPPT
jgi:haloacetate dehalogenase